MSVNQECTNRLFLLVGAKFLRCSNIKLEQYCMIVTGKYLSFSFIIILALLQFSSYYSSKILHFSKRCTWFWQRCLMIFKTLQQQQQNWRRKRRGTWFQTFLNFMVKNWSKHRFLLSVGCSLTACRIHEWGKPAWA